MKPIITLTSDFGTKDYFVGALKGQIHQELPEANIIDISHKIAPFSISETAYIIKNAYKNFPIGSIHIIAVDAEFSHENKHILVYLDGHYFICANNGVMSLIMSKINAEQLIALENNENSTYFLQNFIQAACHIAKGGHLNLLGKSTNDFKLIQELKPTINSEQNKIIGNIIYIDNFGNAISNIDTDLFKKIGKTRKFEIKTKHYSFNKIYHKYNEIVNLNLAKEKRFDEGKKMALFNNDNYLEIAIYKSDLKTVGGASSLLGLKYRDTLTVNFL